MFIGVRRRSGKFWVAEKDGVVESTNSIRRLPVEERWGKDNWRWVKGLPPNKYTGDEYQDGEVGRGTCAGGRDGGNDHMGACEEAGILSWLWWL